jgi:error-prone DNA polymerase
MGTGQRDAQLPARYAELHCRSNFSFLEGASHPEDLAEHGARLGLGALAITDRNGLYGVVRFARAARDVSLPTVFGTELWCQSFSGEITSGDVVVLADGAKGYAPLSRAITHAQLAGRKSEPQVHLHQLAQTVRGSCWVLTGGGSGAVVQALIQHGPAAAEHVTHQLIDAFGKDRVLVELWNHGHPLDIARNDALVHIADRCGVSCVATNNVLYAMPQQHRIAGAFVALRQRKNLDEVDIELAPAATAYLRSPAEQIRRFQRYPGVVEHAGEVGAAAAFDLLLVAPQLPPFPCPNGMSEMSYLRALVEQGATRRYGKRPASSTEDLSLRSRAWKTIDHELAIIESLGFAGYFLIVWDIVQFCERSSILCQGRGSAANSAVCFSLGITKVDAVSLGLLFERFLSPERDGPPDIDIDIESGRREEVIQYVYERYGRHHAAQVANVITYRYRSAVRDASRALGVHVDQPATEAVLELAASIEDMPRHLGIHSGGMVICDRPVSEVCPVEWARMENRSVLQWDKDDCAAIGLVKFDLLGLGMLSALHNSIDFISEHRGYNLDLASLPQEDEVYAMLCRADTVGVFQVESRAQMSTLPRLRPRRFYDLVVEIALIRPGPIQGGSVHPYIKRRNGKEPVTYLHPLLENSLGKTLGVPLFQEQLMQMAIDIAGFTPSEADQLRQAMGSKRSRARMERLKGRLYEGMAERGITDELADQIFHKMASFSSYGFPESHSVSFAYLVYSSAWIKYHEPAIFCASLLNAQPMGFWSPHSLVRDARRHGVLVTTPDINSSAALATLTPNSDSNSQLSVSLGLSAVRGISVDMARRIVSRQPYTSIDHLARCIPELSRSQIEALATAGAFEKSFVEQRRSSLWKAGAHVAGRHHMLDNITALQSVPQLPHMQPIEEAIADLWSTGISPDGHPTVFMRERLTEMGVITADQLLSEVITRKDESSHRVLVAGVVTHRQRPMTAKGATFISLEDETGLINVVCSRGCWARHRDVATHAPALLVRGVAQSADGAVTIRAESLTALHVAATTSSRDFR